MQGQSLFQHCVCDKVSNIKVCPGLGGLKPTFFAARSSNRSPRARARTCTKHEYQSTTIMDLQLVDRQGIVEEMP